jgi:hypothetical protein
MKKTTLFLSFFLLAFFGINSVQAQLITSPGTSDDDYYLIKHVDTKNYLSYSGGNAAPVISPLTDSDATQYFQFKLVEGTTDVYNILNVEADKYIHRLDAGNVWTMGWLVDPNDVNNWGSSATAADVKQNAQFKIIAGGDGTYVLIQNVAGGKYMKADPDGTCYADQSDATAANAQWLLSEPIEGTDKTALQAVYDEALAFYNSTQAGAGSDQYPADARADLWEAIQDAEDVLANASVSQSTVNTTATALSSALSAYKAAVNPFLPDVNATYYIQHAGGSDLFLSGGITLAAGTYAIDQQFKFVRFQTTEYFNIVKASDATQLLTRVSGWGLAWGTEESGLARFRFKSTGAGSYTIECQEKYLNEDGTPVRDNSFMGTDNNDEGTGVYIDKTGTDGKHKWKIIDISTLGLITTALQDAVTKAQEEFLDYAQKGDGPDQYPAAEYDALVNAVAAGNAILANQTGITQTQVGDATLAINNALAAVRGLANPFRPDVTKDYQIVHYGGLYLSAKTFTGYIEGTDPANALALAIRSDADSLKISIPVAPGDSSVNIKFASVPDKYLTRFTGTQVNDDTKYDDYKLVWLDDATSEYAQFEIKRVGIKDYYIIKCIKEGPQRTNSYLGTDDTTAGSSVSIDKNGTVTNHYWQVQIFGEGTAIKPAAVSSVFVSSTNGNLTINRMEGANRIAIYNIAGQLVAKASNTGSQFETQLPKGIYVVTVNGDSPYRGKAIVK